MANAHIDAWIPFRLASCSQILQRSPEVRSSRSITMSSNLSDGLGALQLDPDQPKSSTLPPIPHRVPNLVLTYLLEHSAEFRECHRLRELVSISVAEFGMAVTIARSFDTVSLTLVL